MKKPKICAVIVNDDLKAIKRVEPLVELYEARLDLIGKDWPMVVSELGKPWIACNRSLEEGGNWRGGEAERREELLKALEIGASIIDIELMSGNLDEMVTKIKKRAKCLISLHDFRGTPPLDRLKEIVNKELAVGADICKVVPTAKKFEDNLIVLQLISDFPQTRIVAFAMGIPGLFSRIFCPLVGADFSYAAIKVGSESALGQITVAELNRLYRMISSG